MAERFSESAVEDAALDWLKDLGWAVKGGPEVAPPDCRDGLGSGSGELFAERKDYGEVVLLERFRAALRTKLTFGEIGATLRRMA